MKKKDFSLTQKVFPWMIRKFIVDLTHQKIYIHYSSLFKRSEYTVDLYEVDENPQRFSKKSVGWLIFSIILSLYTALNMIPSLLDPTLYTITIPLTLALLAGTALSWNQYFNKSQDLLVYTSRFHVQHELFSLFTNTSDKRNYHAFVRQLNKVLEDRQGRDLRVIMEQTPATILLETFRTAYIEELMKRDVDVVSLLEALQNYFTKEEERIEEHVN